MKKIFIWEPEIKSATCKIYYNKQTFIGTAFCHSADEDFCSEKTGSYIAELRADIKLLQYLRDCEYKPAYKALNHLYSSMKTNKNFNENSYESKRIRRELHRIKNLLAATTNELAELRLTLRVYIKTKDEFYNKIRAKGQK